MSEFEEKIISYLPNGLYSDGIETLQVNIGRLCNLQCQHCHLDCSPARDEMMTWSVMEQIVEIVKKGTYQLVDITGGAPELHPDFKEFVGALGELGQKVQVRTNLVLLIDEAHKGCAEFLRDNKVQLVASLPCYMEENVAAQRGSGVYEKSIAAILLLNKLGYGVTDDLHLNLVYNPGGAFMAGSQQELEQAYRKELNDRFDIMFTHLLVITNMPIGRFGKSLEERDEMEKYMCVLKDAFNSGTIDGLMCRRQICVDWDGSLYDCDFNLALGEKINHGAPNRLSDFKSDQLVNRKIVTGSHCFACTAGAGSSCGGTIA